MKKLHCLLVVLLGTLACAVASENKSKLGVSIGYTRLSGVGENFSHNTHPQDFFLPGAGVAGSGGQTEIDDLDFLQIGMSYQVQLFEGWLASAEVGCLFGGDRVEQQAANDKRPASNAAYVYSETTWGLYGSVSLTYNFGPDTTGLYVGARANVNDVFFSSGYNRFGSDQEADSTSAILPTFGPVVGWQFSESTAVEASMQLGEAVGGSLMLHFDF